MSSVRLRRARHAPTKNIFPLQATAGVARRKARMFGSMPNGVPRRMLKTSVASGE